MMTKTISLIVILFISRHLFAVDEAFVREQIQQTLKANNEVENTTFSFEGGTVKIQGESLSIDAERDLKKQLLAIDGVEIVDSEIKQTLDFQARLAPVLERIRDSAYDFLALIPVFLVAMLIIFLGWLLAGFVSRRETLFTRFTKNPFLQDILRQSTKAAIVILSIVSALDLIGATSVIGAVLGAAGVLGLAISFAFRDIIENYIAGILLSLRQPFSTGDHVRISEFEGLVIRMTTRATMIKSFDGNNIEMPNATVFKQTIINYNTIPERRFEFAIGIDADADPDVGRRVGIQALRQTAGVMQVPKVMATTDNIGDSSIIITFYGWVDQNHHDFTQVRSAAVRAVKNAIENAGIAIPEPMYGIKMIGEEKLVAQQPADENIHSNFPIHPSPESFAGDDLDVGKSTEIETLVAREQRNLEKNGENLLSK